MQLWQKTFKSRVANVSVSMQELGGSGGMVPQEMF